VPGESDHALLNGAAVGYSWLTRCASSDCECLDYCNTVTEQHKLDSAVAAAAYYSHECSDLNVTAADNTAADVLFDDNLDTACQKLQDTHSHSHLNMTSKQDFWVFNS